MGKWSKKELKKAFEEELKAAEHEEERAEGRTGYEYQRLCAGISLQARRSLAILNRYFNE